MKLGQSPIVTNHIQCTSGTLLRCAVKSLPKMSEREVSTEIGVTEVSLRRKTS